MISCQCNAVAHLAWQMRVCLGRNTLIVVFKIKPFFPQMS